MLRLLRDRYYTVLASVYIFNEHCGYTSLDRVLAAATRRFPDDTAFLAAIRQHRAEERRHYLLFRNWFTRRGQRPLAVDRAYAHIDRLIRLTFGLHADELDTEAIIASEALFARLCRVIVLTEQRGMWQVERLLGGRMIPAEPELAGIFRVIERDEPGHWLPYEQWLAQHGDTAIPWRERMADRSVHLVLMVVLLPWLFINPWAARRADWPDASDSMPALA